MNTTEHILHIANLNNNCPECSKKDGLEISFVQEEQLGKFYSKVGKDVKDTIYCKTCKSVIYPVNWTEDLDRIYQYHKKQAIPMKSGLKLKPISFKLMFLGIGILIIILVLLTQFG
ncbi:hypothetical protein [Ulvibacter antarcticus]|uniref:Uncharacterized protein n=1 Tax=Ulvibacter antarcticus TaxID=442714 RepID=A0A3L9Z0F1_9FLAO|nr:hypothetical protein [Ulvibacter antarcticus]RMA66323.1 hypothetical protein BXY75_0745 [Ulvibacter antarcticus]